MRERYFTADGRFIMTDKDLQRVRLTGEEFVTGIDALMLTREEAERLVADNAFRMGSSYDEWVAAREANAATEAGQTAGEVSEPAEQTDIEPTETIEEE
jgi:hypothetical protein